MASKKQMKEQNEISKEIQEELEAISPNLAHISNQHPYKVPTGYFETLRSEASQIAKDMGVQKVSVIRRLLTVRNVAAAACVIVIAMLVWMNNFKVTEEQLAEVSIDEMIEYLEEESPFGIDEYELVEELIDIESAGIDEEVQVAEPIVVLGDEITDEDIIEYLLEENIDLATIIDVLN